jgi:hypothetical protein
VVLGVLRPVAELKVLEVVYSWRLFEFTLSTVKAALEKFAVTDTVPLPLKSLGNVTVFCTEPVM